MAALFTPPKLKKPERTSDGGMSFFDGAFIAWDKEAEDGAYTSLQRFSGTSPWTTKGFDSAPTPPLHWHLYQDETFEVHEGTLVYIIDGKQGKLTAGQRKTIPARVIHTFWNDSSEGKDLLVSITVRGGPHSGFDKSFVLNWYSHLNTAIPAGQMPNLLSMFRLMAAHDIVLARWPFVGRPANFFIGGLAKLLNFPVEDRQLQV